MSEILHTYASLSLATTRPNAVILEFAREKSPLVLTISKSDAEQLKADLERLLRAFGSWSKSKKL